MDSLKSFSDLAVTMFLITSLSRNVLSAEPELQSLIDKICRSVEDYGFCNKVFNNNIAGHQRNMQGLGEIAQLKALANATSVHLIIMKLIDQTPEGAQKNALKECESAYSLVSSSFQDGLIKFEQKDYQGALNAERVAPRAQDSCSTTFATPPFPKNPLDEQNREARILIAMAITTLLELVGQH